VTDAVLELIGLAKWIEQRFALDSRPKVHQATEAEHIYAEIVRRIATRTEDGQEERKAVGEGS
jgi:hypothetical protein